MIRRSTLRFLQKHCGFPILKVSHVPNKSFQARPTFQASCRVTLLAASASAGASQGALWNSAGSSFWLRALCLCCALFYLELFQALVIDSANPDFGMRVTSSEMSQSPHPIPHPLSLIVMGQLCNEAVSLCLFSWHVNFITHVSGLFTSDITRLFQRVWPIAGAQ